MLVRDILRYKDNKIHFTTKDTSLSKAIDMLNYYNVGALLVLDNKKLKGIVTERDILHALSKYAGKFFELKVQDIMTTKLLTCKASDELKSVMAIMTEKHIRHLPVLEEKIPVGIISIGDVVKGQLSGLE
jgi:CBS domain-containing protein